MICWRETSQAGISLKALSLGAAVAPARKRSTIECTPISSNQKAWAVMALCELLASLISDCGNSFNFLGIPFGNKPRNIRPFMRQKVAIGDFLTVAIAS
jgi:hypothetical protein